MANKVFSLPIMNNKRWSKEEDDFFRKNYKKIYAVNLAKELKRSRGSIYKRAMKLGLTDRSKCANHWTLAEITILKENYSKIGPKQTCKLVNRTQAATQAKAQSLGIRQKRGPHLGTRALKLKHKYGLTLEDYDKMVEAQNGLCAICNQPETKKHQNGAVIRLSVDHCHDTNEIRGLLCYKCNLLIGHAEDSIQVLKSAIKYLKKASDSDE